jgi:hypothetical protein
VVVFLEFGGQVAHLEAKSSLLGRVLAVGRSNLLSWVEFPLILGEDICSWGESLVMVAFIVEGAELFSSWGRFLKC